MTLCKSLAWFRHDLRAFDHAALHHALTSSKSVHCAFIYDSTILDALERDDRRVSFIHASLAVLIPALAAELGAEAVFINGDDEPQAIARDQAAAEILQETGRRFFAYGEARNYPAVKGPSYLSVHLRFGTLSIRHQVRTVCALIANGAGGEGAPMWLSELIWREFYAMILFHHPHVTGRAFKPTYDAIEWESGARAEQLFGAWREGRTGYPLVDAAMLQLNQTGYMHNRLRMVAASFLVKDLGIDWRRGEQYFARQLNDFELASNNGAWQWAASTGCDAQPYFRIFNPITRSEKFDAQGKFIRKYLPQLGTLTDKEIHAPWLAATKISNYPGPIVKHDEARKKTLERYAIVKAA